MYTIEQTENPAQFVLYDHVMQMSIAAGSYKEMQALQASLTFNADEIL